MNEKIAHVEFRVWFEAGRWIARYTNQEAGACGSGEGSTPITALMSAEIKARKAVR